MNMTSQHEQALIEKLKRLPPERIAEVEDFVDFLQSRDNARGLTRAAMKSSEAAFGRVWDNEDDAAYDQL
jgi:hypothetical protein